MKQSLVYFVGGSGAFLTLLSAMLFLYGNDRFLLYLLSRGLALRTDSEALQRWKMAPQPVLFKVYLWNVTNAREVSAGEKPKLSEVGPYVYEQWLDKANVREESNDTLSYNLNPRMYFNEELTGYLRESDVVTVIHLPVVGMVLRVNEIMPDFLSYLEEVWPTLFPGLSDIFLTGTVRELLFDGIPIDCTSKNFIITTICNNLEGDLPNTIRKVGNKEFKFSFFHYKNRTSKEVMRVYRGIDDLARLDETYSFNNGTSIDKWHDKYCDMINGSDGSHFPVMLKPDSLVYIFQPDLCRSMYARYEGETFREKVRLFRFVNTPDLLASPEVNPDNECFCSPKAQLGDIVGGGDKTEEADDEPPEKTCMKNGAMLLTPCMGAPLVITFPHFYLADETYSEYVDLQPDKERHQTFVELEPTTGTPVSASKRIQFNIEVKPIPDVSMMSNLTPGLFPTLWVEEALELTEDNFSALKKALSHLKYAGVFGYVLAGLGASLVTVAGMLHAKKNKLLCWETALDADFDDNRFGARGVYSQHVKGTFPPDRRANVPDFHAPSRRSRVFPKHSNGVAYGENFM